MAGSGLKLPSREESPTKPNKRQHPGLVKNAIEIAVKVGDDPKLVAARQPFEHSAGWQPGRSETPAQRNG